MTSEVLVLNKRAIVIAADSAVTTSGGKHPRYSKTAMKVFEVSRCGSIAAMIFGAASMDQVPWEISLKMFRAHLGDQRFPTVSEYLDEFLKFIECNTLIYPEALRSSELGRHFDQAVQNVVEIAKNSAPDILDIAVPLQDRQAKWKAEAAAIRGNFSKIGLSGSLTQGKLDDRLRDMAEWQRRVTDQLAQVPDLAAIDAVELAELAMRALFAMPDIMLSDTGLVFAGYGESQIFPAYRQIDIHGHIGNDLAFKESKKFEITHESTGMIQPLAQTSMIDVFTDGFGWSLRKIIDQASKNQFEKLFVELAAAGHNIPGPLAESLKEKAHSDFTSEWVKENWNQNFYPLVRVIMSLSVEEMAHLAETLLVLESLKERVTSPSESVGGPIDVAAITKAEGLVWIKRKHFFDPALNMRYAARLGHSFTK